MEAKLQQSHHTITLTQTDHRLRKRINGVFLTISPQPLQSKFLRETCKKVQTGLICGIASIVGWLDRIDSEVPAKYTDLKRFHYVLN